MNENSYELMHNLVIENRTKASVSGVKSVASFDENMIVMLTNAGNMTITGEDLHIDKLDLEIGDMALSGKIISVDYDDDVRDSRGFFSRLFG